MHVRTTNTNQENGKTRESHAKARTIDNHTEMYVHLPTAMLTDIKVALFYCLPKF